MELGAVLAQKMGEFKQNKSEEKMRIFIITLALIFVTAISLKASERTYEVDEIKADFTRLYEGLKSAHYDLYQYISKEEYDALFDQMLAEFKAQLTHTEAQIKFQRFVAFGRVAHAKIGFPDAAYQAFRESGGRAFPIYPRFLGERLFVGENLSDQPSIQVGDEVLALNGTPIEEVLADLRRYISADTSYMAHALLEFKLPHYLWLYWGEVDEFSLTLKRRTGEAYEVTIRALTSEEVNANSEKLSDVFSLDPYTRSAKMLMDGVAYLRPGPFFNVEQPEKPWDTKNYLAFIDHAFNSFKQSNAKKLIIDIRLNLGGDASFSDPILARFADKPFRFNSIFRVKSSPEAEAANAARLAGRPDDSDSISARYAREYAAVDYGEHFEIDLPYVSPKPAAERFEGDVFILINRHSFSNAVVMAAEARDYGFATIVGEPTSDMATTLGAMEHFKLPVTGIAVGFPKALVVRPSGKQQLHNLVPDISIDTPLIATKEDSVLNQLIDCLSTHPLDCR